MTPEQRAELKSLSALRDDAIDTSDVPELLDWSGARRGLFYRPVKQQLTLRLDADVVAWFKSHTTSNEGYQTGINRALRRAREGAGKPNSAIQGLALRNAPFAQMRDAERFGGDGGVDGRRNLAASYNGAPERIRTSDPQIRSLM